MKLIKLSLIVLLISTVFYSCTSIRNNNFAKVKYLDKHLTKKQQIKNKADEISYKIIEDTLSNTLLLPDSYEANIEQELLPKNEIKTLVNLADRNKIVSDFQNKAVTINSNEEIYSEIILENSSFSSNMPINEPKKVEPIIKIILAFLLPPLAVFLHRGLDTYFWISLILTILIWVPGVIFALLVVLDAL